MKRLKNVFFAVIISPEFVILLLLVYSVINYPEMVTEFGNKLRSDADVWKYMPTLILMFSGAAFTFSSKIRAPLEGSSNKLLYEWPLYQLLVDRVIVSLALSSICGATGLLLWFVGQSFSSLVIGSLFIGTASISAVTALTMLLAHQKLREFIDRYNV